MIGRRVATVEEIERPGDYCGPISTEPWTGRKLPMAVAGCFFLLPNALDEGAQPGQRAVHHVLFPPHTYRESAGGSLEIRNSIGAQPYWHGFLDEGHVWREC